MPAEQNINLARREFVKSLPLYFLERIQSMLNQLVSHSNPDVILSEAKDLKTEILRCADRAAPQHQAAARRSNKRRRFAPQNDILNDRSDQPLVAAISVTRCLAWGNSLCQACYLACPLRDRAIEIVDQKPIINREICNGCG